MILIFVLVAAGCASPAVVPPVEPLPSSPAPRAAPAAPLPEAATAPAPEPSAASSAAGEAPPLPVVWPAQVLLAGTLGERHVSITLHYQAGALTGEGTTFLPTKPIRLAGKAQGGDVELHELGPNDAVLGTVKGTFASFGPSDLATLDGSWTTPGTSSASEQYAHLREELQIPGVEVLPQLLVDEPPLLRLDIRYPEVRGKGAFTQLNAWARREALSFVSQLRASSAARRAELVKKGWTSARMYAAVKSGDLAASEIVGDYALLFADERFLTEWITVGVNDVLGRPFSQGSCITVERDSGRLLGSAADFFGKNDPKPLLKTILKRITGEDLDDATGGTNPVPRFCVGPRGLSVRFNLGSGNPIDGTPLPYAELASILRPELAPHLVGIR